MAFVRKVNRTCTTSHCTCVFIRYELRKNYPKEDFVKKNNYLFTKKDLVLSQRKQASYI